MKVKVVKQEIFYAIDENNESYIIKSDIKNFKDGEILEGDVIEKEEQDFYDDGTPSRSYSITKYFVPNVKKL